MDRRRRASVATFFSEESFAAGGSIVLPDDAAQHAHVRRMQVGDSIRLTNGRGALGEGILERLTKGTAVARVDAAREIARPPTLRLFVPVADRDRMLWLAEKSAEVAVSEWQPVLFHRSASVSPRGEGEKFKQRVRARMISALEQSGGAWLPEICSDATLADALVRAAATANRFFLERDGAPLVTQRPGPATIMVGPEGGVEDEERVLIVEHHHWLPVSLGDTTLRFETAAVVGAGLLRALLANA